MNKKIVLLTILDGWGAASKCEENAIASAQTPTFDSLIENYPYTTIHADGEYVGLPEGQMGNSEVGHLNIGAGRTVYQELTRINKSIKDGDFFTNAEFLKAIEHVKKNNSSLHFMGLVSPGGVHSSMDHIFALIDFACTNSLKDVYLHAFLDGRDTPPQSAVGYVQEIENKLKECSLPPVATVCGRYYAMDRDNRWERVEQAYNCLILGEGNCGKSVVEAIEESYAKGINDEFVLPTVIGGDKSRFKDGDAIIFFNFRPDRARELSRAINSHDFDGFDRKKVLENIYYICMTQYDEKFGLPTAFSPQSLKGILGEVLENNGIKQFRTAETEKYAHVTFFFNGGVEKPFANEIRVLVNSPKVATYDLQPEMSAFEVKDKVVEAVKSGVYQFILVNFANPDMVGHTGVFDAAVKAIETIDNCLKDILAAVKETGATMLITADHGNAECMIDPETKAPFTAHTTNIVPFSVVNYDEHISLRSDGTLADIAPTVLDILEIPKPLEMTGNSMILR